MCGEARPVTTAAAALQDPRCRADQSQIDKGRADRANLDGLGSTSLSNHHLAVGTERENLTGGGLTGGNTHNPHARLIAPRAHVQGSLVAVGVRDDLVPDDPGRQLLRAGGQVDGEDVHDGTMAGLLGPIQSQRATRHS